MRCLPILTRTIHLSGAASSDGTNWQSLVHSVGNSGTGDFENLTVTGSFFPTSDPNVYTFDMDLVYH
jgi:hypothetical protein